jgi:hypothetical protein
MATAIGRWSAGLFLTVPFACCLTLASWDQLVAPVSGGCGLLHRDAVRSATDTAAGGIDHQPKATTIAALVAAPAPAVTFWSARIAPMETTVWRLRASVTAVTGPLDDGDYHLRLVDAEGHRMVAESAAPNCAAGSPFLAEISQVRATIGRGLPLNTPLTFTGLGFFDTDHGVVGAAPNGIELHPLLGIAQ